MAGIDEPSPTIEIVPPTALGPHALRDRLCRRVAAGELMPDLAAPPEHPEPELPSVEGYRILGLVASGGMGMVYAAIAAATGLKVALKLVRRDQHGLTATERVLREVRALSAVPHPGIVKYIDHGMTPLGAPYLVTEWLDGVDLEDRLHDGPLSLQDALALASRLAEALAAAHERGVIHRDIKPANIFLVGGRPEQARLLDFGIVRFQTRMRTLTQPGGIVGTPAYMSPEQARGEPGIDHRTDLFSLGCVLHECISGQPAFPGEHVMAVLARILMENPRRIRELVPGVPSMLDRIVAQLLEKDPRDRWASARELAVRLRELVMDPASSPAAEPEAITDQEQVFHSILFIRGEEDGPTGPASLRRLAVQFLARHLTLVDGTHLIHMTGENVAVDQAAKAARCALVLAAQAPHVAIAVVSGRAVVTGRSVVGQVLDRGAGLVLLAPAGQIRIDDVTASLLDASFEVVADPHGSRLVAARDAPPGARRLMGQTTPLVGRGKELAYLEAGFVECSEDRCAAAIVVIGEAGIGKSRLRHELDARIRARAPHVTRLIGRADPMRTHAPLALLARALHGAAELDDREPPEVRRGKLRERLAAHLPPQAVDDAVLYLGELVSAFPVDPPLELALARKSSAVLRERIADAWCTWLRAECSAGPVVLVLEDLHWADAASVQVVETLLEALADCPLLVVALARPSVREQFSELWSRPEVECLELLPLSPRAARKLVHGVLGQAVDRADVERVVSGARGNAFFLEELIRAVADGSGADLPDTVFGMMQTRLSALGARERQVLRAASVFGRTSWRGGVGVLLGQKAHSDDLDTTLARLIVGEWLVPQPRSRVPGEEEYAFRHALVCDAAYATLTDEDRILAHHLAGQWLEKAGGQEAVVLAEHFLRGEDDAAATAWFAEAADQAFERHEFDVVLQIVERGLGRASKGEARGRLLLRRAEVFAISGRHHDAAQSALAALGEFPSSSLRWYSAAGEAALASGRSGDAQQVIAIADKILSIETPDGGGAVHLVGLVRAALPLATAGETTAAWQILDKIVQVTEASRDPQVVGPMHSARALRGLITGAQDSAYEEMEAAAQAFERIGSARDALEHLAGAGFFLLELGCLPRGEAILRRTIERSVELGLEHLCAVARHNLGRRIGETGRLDEGLELEHLALASFGRHGNQRMTGLTQCHIAWLLLLAGRTAAAAEHAEQAVEGLGEHPAARPIAFAMRAQVRMKAGAADAAVEDARLALDGLEYLGQVQEGESLIRLTWAEALAAAGRQDEARVAILVAQRWLTVRANLIADRELRASFRSNVLENARTDEHAREWCAQG
jgi:serine/threonine protein kinase/tetratricopeptide (TPR) repeat protein